MQLKGDVIQTKKVMDSTLKHVLQGKDCSIE